MDALNSSSLKTIFFDDRSSRRSGAFANSIAFLRPASRFAPWPKLDLGFSVAGRSIALQKKLIRSVLESSPLSVESEVHAETIDNEDTVVQAAYQTKTDEETVVQATYQTKTVHVKFQLQKECRFGQQFLLTGEDPMFGLWDPLNAVPLDWSDDHVWLVELDIPVGKTIQFKFILKGITGDIEWQPGPDRIVQTWDTEKTVVVLEDWGNAELQQIIEEEYVDNLKEKSIFQTEESEVHIEKPILNPTDELVTNPTKESISAESIVESNGRAVTNDNLRSVKDEEILIIDEGVPVLVPGLAPVPEFGMEEEFSEDVSNGMVINAYVTTDEASDCHTPELCGTQEPDPSNENSLHEEKTVMTYDDVSEEKLHGDEPEETMTGGHEEKPQSTEEPAVDVLKNDRHWGRKILQKFFLNLGSYINELN